MKPFHRKSILGLALACLSIAGMFPGVADNCAAAIIYAKEPTGGRQLVLKEVSSALRSPPRGFLGGFRAAELTITAPCQNYYVGLTNLASGQLLREIKASGGWTYPIIHGTNEHGTNVVGWGGLVVNEKTGRVMNDISVGENVMAKATPEALRIAQQLPQVKRQDYELRNLESPGILFSAVWLHGKSDDIIIPLPPTLGRWNAFQPYSEEEMIKLLQPAAQDTLRKTLPRGAGGG